MPDGKKYGQHLRKDYTGQRFGCLTATRDRGSTGKKRLWEFRCDCGETVVRLPVDVQKSVQKGCTPSCGCQMGEANKTHGMSQHPAYWVWRSMCDRCRLPSHQAWKNYGARGITVCPEWRESFETFWADMKAGYRPGLTLERMDNNRGYTPKNCQWRSYRHQSNNRRTNVHINTPSGPMTVSQAARLYKIGRSTLAWRVEHWPEERWFRPTTS